MLGSPIPLERLDARGDRPQALADDGAREIGDRLVDVLALGGRQQIGVDGERLARGGEDLLRLDARLDQAALLQVLLTVIEGGEEHLFHLGVVEAGLIAGLTSAGIPQDQAVAAVLIQRFFTSYLPPVWGWATLAWM